MNEFEWRRQLRDLRQPLVPRADLWASIDAALDDAELLPAVAPVALPSAHQKHPARWLMAAGMAASIALAGIVGWYARYVSTAASMASTQKNSVASNWKPADPRFTGAATQLNAARAELQQAIEQAPDSPALQRLLIRTESQQSQLRQLTREAG
jgi:hypothetical protein